MLKNASIPSGMVEWYLGTQLVSESEPSDQRQEHIWILLQESVPWKKNEQTIFFSLDLMLFLTNFSFLFINLNIWVSFFERRGSQTLERGFIIIQPPLFSTLSPRGQIQEYILILRHRQTNWVQDTGVHWIVNI